MDLYIILPGKIGDIIICAPIAKHYSERGYNIVWPVFEEIIDNFQYGHMPYVNFIKHTSIEDTYTLVSDTNSEVLDLTLTNYELQNMHSFDEYRYNMAGVDINEKWNLDINRNIERESELYTSLDIYTDRYILTHLSSDKNNLHLNVETPIKAINISKQTKCVFDWIKIIEHAEALFFIESCFSNLTDQLSIINNLQVLYPQPRIDAATLINGRPRCLPKLKNNWYYVS